MATHSTVYVKAVIPPCERFAAARCMDGYCQYDHHENLEPCLVGSREPKGYMVPNKFGEACQNCLGNLREVKAQLCPGGRCSNLAQCDKKQRGPDDRDPCSECRHFGGTECACTLSMESSYNTVVYDKLLSRGHVYDYTLAPPDDRVKGPMPPHRIKKGWVGQTKEQLLMKPDFLPSGVRECPRAFVVTPQEHLQPMSRESSPDSDQLWQLPATFWNLPSSLPPPSFSRPSPMMISDKVKYSTGEVKFSTFVWEISQWRHVYETGYTQPCSLPPPSFSRPQPDPTAGKVMHTTFIWDTDQWRHVYENNTFVTFPYIQHDLTDNGDCRMDIFDYGSDDST